jgi:hypothetical protein
MQNYFIKFLSYFKSLLKRIIGHEEKNIFSNNISISEFRVIIQQNYELHLVPNGLKRTKMLQEKLFCINCINLMKSYGDQVDPLYRLLHELFCGHYDVKMNEQDAKVLYDKLDFASRLFLQERNRSIKRLFSKNSM